MMTSPFSPCEIVAIIREAMREHDNGQLNDNGFIKVVKSVVEDNDFELIRRPP